MTAREAHEIIGQAKKSRVFATRFLYATDAYEIRFSQYSQAVFRKYEAARVFLLSIRIETGLN